MIWLSHTYSCFLLQAVRLDVREKVRINQVLHTEILFQACFHSQLKENVKSKLIKTNMKTDRQKIIEKPYLLLLLNLPSLRSLLPRLLRLWGARGPPIHHLARSLGQIRRGPRIYNVSRRGSQEDRMSGLPVHPQLQEKPWPPWFSELGGFWH